MFWLRKNLFESATYFFFERFALKIAFENSFSEFTLNFPLRISLWKYPFALVSPRLTYKKYTFSQRHIFFFEKCILRFPFNISFQNPLWIFLLKDFLWKLSFDVGAGGGGLCWLTKRIPFKSATYLYTLKGSLWRLSLKMPFHKSLWKYSFKECIWKFCLHA